MNDHISVLVILYINTIIIFNNNITYYLTIVVYFSFHSHN